ncbi:MAG: tellurium resistance protein, partial [Pseudomonadota bacterium]
TGASTEYLNLYVGITDLSNIRPLGGLDVEDEDICSKVLPFSELMDMVDAHRMNDLPLLAVANWLARHRQRLRATY